jgi:hypothetical protein
MKITPFRKHYEKLFLFVFVAFVSGCIKNTNNIPKDNLHLLQRESLKDCLFLDKPDLTNHKTVLDTCIGKFRLIILQKKIKDDFYESDFFLVKDNISNDTIFLTKEPSFGDLIIKIENNLFAIRYANEGNCDECDAYHLFYIDNKLFKFCGNFHKAKDINFDGKKEFIFGHCIWSDILCHAEQPEYENIYLLDKNLQLHTDTLCEDLKYQPLYNKLISVLSQKINKKFSQEDYCNILVVSYYCQKLKRYEQLNQIKELIVGGQFLFPGYKDSLLPAINIADEIESLVIDSSYLMYRNQENY